MKRNISIQLKAAFLLVVFALNTLVGFACALGVDMSFNIAHHHDEATEVSIHVHADGKKHEHHNKQAKHHHEENKSSKREKDDCCNAKIIKFQSLDKNLGQNAKTASDTPVFTAILGGLFGINIAKAFQAAPQKYLARNFHPPPSDIRIAIRSFQI